MKKDMKKREYLAKQDIKGLVKAGLVSCKVIRDMELYDYYQERKRSSRRATYDTAVKYRIEPSQVWRIIKDMDREV